MSGPAMRSTWPPRERGTSSRGQEQEQGSRPGDERECDEHSSRARTTRNVPKPVSPKMRRLPLRDGREKRAADLAVERKADDVETFGPIVNATMARPAAGHEWRTGRRGQTPQRSRR